MSKINHKELPKLLASHDLDSEGLSRGAMSRLYVSQVVEKKGLCVDRACPCYTSGIGCHHATCACTCTSNFVPLTPRKSRRMSMDGTDNIVGPTLTVRCANPAGKYNYEEQKVSNFRKNILRKMQVQETE